MAKFVLVVFVWMIAGRRGCGRAPPLLCPSRFSRPLSTQNLGVLGSLREKVRRWAVATGATVRHSGRQRCWEHGGAGGRPGCAATQWAPVLKQMVRLGAFPLCSNHTRTTTRSTNVISESPRPRCTSPSRCFSPNTRCAPNNAGRPSRTAVKPPSGS